jgi:glycolate oxidase FAD binding subunit
MTQHAPADEAGIQAVLAEAFSARTPVLVQGAGTKSSMLRPVQAAHTLSTAACSGITLYSPKELIVSARAGTTLAELETLLAQSGQHMIAEPPDYTRLLGGDGAQTLGGLIAANLSGPRRVCSGALRDHVLGMRAVNGAGEVIKSGGRVLKNVTGLDMCKLLAGSHGTLAVMTEITLKVLPAPEDTASIVLRGLAPAQAVAALSAALGSPYGVSAAAHLPPAAAALLGSAESLTIARLEDFAASVAYRSERLRQELGAFGAAEIWPATQSRDVWAATRDAKVLPQSDGDAIWRVSVRPSRGPHILAAAEQNGAQAYLDWGGGLVMIAGPATPELHAALTAAAREAGGVWTVLRAPSAWRTAVDVLPPEPAPLAAISRRVKSAMDPAGILNPGRMFANL